MSFDFKFKRNFKGLITDDYQDAYDEVSVRFSGVLTLWATLDSTTREAKRTLCFNYLVAWYLSDLYPFKVDGIDADGRPLNSKSIGGTFISFATIGNRDSTLQELTSNPFGMKAKTMIETAPEMMGIYG